LLPLMLLLTTSAVGSPQRPLSALREWSRFVTNNIGRRRVTAGVIMRRRTRRTSISGKPSEWPARTVDDAIDAATRTDAPFDEALRALARLLARQAAREIFEREYGEDVTCSDRQQ
jgi:hypothetical protein